ncbi:MAG: nitroreductase family deazaflavin-dependent oxidoreductase [Dehalococcoidia bacterium]|nr:nitroreductase family deazaflavin-dependent oxidoreductase [Dehalococcoidia bacterium]
MPEYIPSPAQWVRDQVELYERTNGAEGNTLRDSGLPVVIVTNTGHRTGAVRKTPLMRVADGPRYVLVGSQGGAPQHPQWVHNLRAHPDIDLRDRDVVRRMRVRELEGADRERCWALAVEAFPPYADYQTRTDRRIPVFLAEPIDAT